MSVEFLSKLRCRSQLLEFCRQPTASLKQKPRRLCCRNVDISVAIPQFGVKCFWVSVSRMTHYPKFEPKIHDDE